MSEMFAKKLWRLIISLLETIVKVVVIVGAIVVIGAGSLGILSGS